MNIKVRMLSLILICVMVLGGCSNQNSVKENAQLKIEIESLKQKVENFKDTSKQQVEILVKENAQLKTEIKSIKQQVENLKDTAKQQDDLYELRNNLDNNLYITLRTLSKGDFKSAQQNMAPNMCIENKKVITTTNVDDYEFIIPDKLMNLRQRAFMINDSKYIAIYEINDAGYISGAKYCDRIYTLNVTYSQVDGQWKISSLKIDE